MIIEFGILSYKLLLLLLYPIFYLISNIILPKDESPLYQGFSKSLGYLLSGLFYLFIKYRSGKSKKLLFTLEKTEDKTTAISQVYAENQNIIKKRKIKKLKSILTLSLTNMIPTIIEIIFLKLLHSDESFLSSFRILSILVFLSFFSKVFLNSRIYRHQNISLVIIYTSLLFIFSMHIIQLYIQNNLDFLNFNNLLNLLYSILLFGFYALYDVLVKKHFEFHSTNPYHLMFLIGLFNFILIIPLDLFVYVYNDKDLFGLEIINQIQKFFELYNPIFFLRFILDIISGFLWIAGIILTLYYFTPCHIIISFIFLQYLFKCIELIKKQEKYEWYLILINFILYSIIFISSLIYNEIIIVHLWSMQKNTFKYISIRQKLEFENSLDNYEGNLIKNNILNDKSFDEEEGIEENEKQCYY